MLPIGRVALLVRYPVKSMAGEILSETLLTESGIANDRLYAFRSSSAPTGMLHLSGRARRQMLGYAPKLNGNEEISVTVPSGETYPIDSTSLIKHFNDHIAQHSHFSLVRSQVPQTDVRPLSLISLQTVQQLSTELGVPLDYRRFRANIILDGVAGAFAEDMLVGKTVQIGSKASLRILERDPRCRLITYDPDSPITEEPLFEIMRLLDKNHQGRAGVYATVLTPGVIHIGDIVDVRATT